MLGRGLLAGAGLVTVEELDLDARIFLGVGDANDAHSLGWCAIPKAVDPLLADDHRNVF